MSEKIAIEEVGAVEAPPRARVEATFDASAETSAGVAETFERKRDYLAGFLAQQPEADPAGGEGGALQLAVIDALKEICDPEIPVNIYDLGLIYGVEVTDNGEAVVTMTLTTPHCPVAETMPAEVELRVSAVPGIATADVNLVWDPAWDPAKMSDDAKLELGML